MSDSPQGRCRCGGLMRSLLFVVVLFLLGTHALLKASPETAGQIANLLPASLVGTDSAAGDSCCMTRAKADYAGKYSCSGGCGPIFRFTDEGTSPSGCAGQCPSDRGESTGEESQTDVSLTFNDWLPELEPAGNGQGG